MIIGLCGRKRSGKDAVADIICTLAPDFTRFAFADPMKTMAIEIDPMIEIDGDEKKLLGWIGVQHHPAYRRLGELVAMLGWDEAKKIADVRRFLQRLGTEGGRKVLGQDVWVDRTFVDVDRVVAQGTSVVLTDVRFVNEIGAVRARGGMLWRIERPGQEEDTSTTGRHVSEHEWRSIVPERIIFNDRTLAELADTVRSTLLSVAAMET